MTKTKRQPYGQVTCAICGHTGDIPATAEWDDLPDSPDPLRGKMSWTLIWFARVVGWQELSTTRSDGWPHLMCPKCQTSSVAPSRSSVAAENSEGSAQS